MRWRHTVSDGCDALDVAALWPMSAQLAGIPIPEIERDARTVGDRVRKEVD